MTSARYAKVRLSCRARSPIPLKEAFAGLLHAFSNHLDKVLRQNGSKPLNFFVMSPFYGPHPQLSHDKLKTFSRHSRGNVTWKVGVMHYLGLSISIRTFLSGFYCSLNVDIFDDKAIVL